MGAFEELVERKGAGGWVHEAEEARVVLAPDLGGRVFCELKGVSLHRLDIENVRDPHRAFNNYGGNNFWPAPEGGMFGFNYQGDRWYVQPGINEAPFALDWRGASQGRVRKETVLVNRKGVRLNVVMERTVAVEAAPGWISQLRPVAALSYSVEDRIAVQNRVTPEEALLGCWTLEQFDAGDQTVSFVKVAGGREAINFDFYADPTNKISYGAEGFVYRTDSKQRGQIGIRKDARAEYVGFYDPERKLLCIREIVGEPEGRYFNIADNEQPAGPFSAADSYSIFNGDERMGFFEVETIGGAQVRDGYLTGSSLRSRSSFALFETAEPLRRFIKALC